MNAIIMLLVSPWLRWLTADHEIDGWDDVAAQWAAAIVVISVFVSAVAVGVKWAIKAVRGRGIIKRITWSRAVAWGSIVAGLLGVLLVCVVWWSFGRDLRMIVGYRGLVTGIFSAWTIHLLIVGGFHWAFHWNREL